jgi:hypothetical protein
MSDPFLGGMSSNENYPPFSADKNHLPAAAPHK